MEQLKLFYKDPFVDVVYDIVESETRGLDSVYEDYILTLVGIRGLNALVINELVKAHKTDGGRQMFTLVDKKGVEKL